MPSVEVRVDSGGADGVPHAFIVTTDKFGNEHGFEFAPAEHLNLWGPGKVYDDTNHEYDNSWSYEITQQQFDDLQGFIYQREHNPGVYEGWDRNCVKFVADALRSAGIDDLHSAPLTHPVELWWKQKLTPYWENVRNFFNNAQKWLLPRRDPLTLDLNNNGLETTAPNPTHPVLFDMDGDGVKNGTGWVAPTDGFLVWDKNG
ncbi:MAG: hemolysin-type calcium binding protein, partial [Rhodocyclales bacterium]|nr:hemolysin-type calcium binding protein [Rhodocyclales bacterium]